LRFFGLRRFDFGLIPLIFGGFATEGSPQIAQTDADLNARAQRVERRKGSVREKINNLFFLKMAWNGLERLGTAWNGLNEKFEVDEDF
jgi:hypothetical protein